LPFADDPIRTRERAQRDNRRNLAELPLALRPSWLDPAFTGSGSRNHRIEEAVLRKLVALLCAVAAIAIVAISPAAASAWAPASSAAVHPGVMTFTEGAQCTANFIYSDGTNTYIGQAAHCSGTGAATDTNGCDSESLPIGTPVEVDGASKPGTMAYNSWITMQQKGETNEDACAYNDLALVKLDPADVANTNPSVPGYGGPTGVGSVGDLGSNVYSYGNSSLRFGVTQFSPKRGVIVENEGNGWSHNAYTLTPGIPGDSGSGFMNDSGQAIGVLSTIELLPRAGSNNFGDLAHEIAYMHANSSFSGVNLVPGTEAFNSDWVNAILSS
jgi:hypothetical protein